MEGLMTRINGLWTSGEVCDMTGKYCAHCCGRELDRRFVLDDIFPRCPSCGKKVKWERCLANVLPINLEKGAREPWPKDRR